MVCADLVLGRGAGRRPTSVARRAMRLRGRMGRGGADRPGFLVGLLFDFRAVIRFRGGVRPRRLPRVPFRRLAMMNPRARFLHKSYSN